MSGSSKPAEASDDHGKKTEETQSSGPIDADEKSKNHGMVYAEKLNITWCPKPPETPDPRYWRWVREKETSDGHLVAELLNVCWLHVSGQLETEKLSPGTLYEVVFVGKMKTKAYGWDGPVNFKFTPPDGTNPTFEKINLADKLKDSKDQWKDIALGEFTAPENPGNNIVFSLYEHGGKWKSGLVIKGVAVRPKKD